MNNPDTSLYHYNYQTHPIIRILTNMSQFGYAQSNSLLNQEKELTPSASEIDSDGDGDTSLQKIPRCMIELSDHNGRPDAELPPEKRARRRNSRVSLRAAETSTNAVAAISIENAGTGNSTNGNDNSGPDDHTSNPSAAFAHTKKKKIKPVKTSRPAKHELPQSLAATATTATATPSTAVAATATTTTAPATPATAAVATANTTASASATSTPDTRAIVGVAVAVGYGSASESEPDTETSTPAETVPATSAYRKRNPRVRKPRRIIAKTKIYIPENEQPTPTDVVGGRGGESCWILFYSIV